MCWVMQPTLPNRFYLHVQRYPQQFVTTLKRKGGNGYWTLRSAYNAKRRLLASGYASVKVAETCLMLA